MGTKGTLRVVLVGLVLLMLFGCSKAVEAGGGDQTTQMLGVSSQSSGGASDLPGIYVSGTGTATAQPDLALISLGVETVSGEPGQAVDENTSRMNAVMDVLTGMQIEAKDLETISYNVWVEQVMDKDGMPADQMRYHAVNLVRVRLHDLSRTGELLTKALEAGANTVQGITFAVADSSSLEREARDLAIANAKAKAEQYATGLGAKLGALRQVSEIPGVIAFPSRSLSAYGGGMGGGGDVSVSAGELSVSVQIEVVFDLAS